MMERQPHPTNSSDTNQGNNWFIFFAAFSASLATFTTGSCYVWTSPMLPKFNSSDPTINPIGRPITIDESAWIVSALSVGLIFGPIISIICQKFATKKLALLVSMSLIVIANIICIFADQPYVFIIIRLLMGVASGSIWPVIGTYMGEISEDKIRGLLGCLPGIACNLGGLLVYVTGPYLNLTWFSIAITIPIIIFFICFGVFVPDSPYDLVVKGNYEEAEKSLKVLRTRSNVEKELYFIKGNVDSGYETEVHFSDLLRNRALRKGLLICSSLMAIQQLSINFAMLSYVEVIFKMASDFIPSSLCPIILGIVGTIATSLSSHLIDKIGRKILMISSCFMVGVSLFILAGYFWALDHKLNVSKITWLPLTCLILYMVSYNLALVIIPWVVTGEIFHSSVKPLASTITALANYTLVFVVSLCFPYLSSFLGMSYTFGIFGLCMILGMIFCISVLPETKGKNFQEIQKLLND